MIRYDGYYIEEPTEIINGRAKTNKVSFSFKAYHFDEDNYFWVTSKHDHLDLLSDFSKSDFKSQIEDRTTYKEDSNKIIVQKEYEFSKDLVFEIDNPDEIVNKLTKKKSYFISWEELEKNESKDFEGSLLNKIFRPFDHGKYNVFYE
ncbi:MAG: hypothetical protein CMB99_10560 [Flavobacteriaceae bacterium]|nr:hypothetical protein [Flavobacteriaceae bacterium]|tara:strand:+ start:226596 stop:227036 length:441 start_codon:yes stop_codon:yes gene_type:complete